MPCSRIAGSRGAGGRVHTGGMDWTPALEAARKEHDDLCVVTGCDWNYCPRTPPVPEVARRLGLVEVTITLADRERDVVAVPDRPDLDDTWCTCGHKRRGHSVDGSRCFASPCPCTFEGGWRDRDRPDTWGETRRVLSLNPEATGQQFGEAVQRPDWFQHGD